MRGAPDLVVEILSAGTEARDRGLKLKAYARYGVAGYWIVDPVAEVVEVYHLGAQGFELVTKSAKGGAVQTPLLPGLSLPVSSIFHP